MVWSAYRDRSHNEMPRLWKSARRTKNTNEHKNRKKCEHWIAHIILSSKSSAFAVSIVCCLFGLQTARWMLRCNRVWTWLSAVLFITQVRKILCVSFFFFFEFVHIFIVCRLRSKTARSHSASMCFFFFVNSFDRYGEWSEKYRRYQAHELFYLNSVCITLCKRVFFLLFRWYSERCIQHGMVVLVPREAEQILFMLGRWNMHLIMNCKT